METKLAADDLESLKRTVAVYDKFSLFSALDNSIALYRSLRKDLFGTDVQLHRQTEEKVMDYLAAIKNKRLAQ